MPITEKDEAQIAFAHEAINKLGYLKETAVDTVIFLMQQASSFEGPQAITTKYRKSGEQLTAPEKRALRIRANSFMSKQALNELTERGRHIPLEAHLLTFWRASMSEARYDALQKGMEIGADYYIYNTVSHSCPGCLRLAGRKFSLEDIDPNPPGDCFRDDCPCLISPQIDFAGRFAARLKT